MADEVIAPGDAPEPERDETPSEEPVTTPTPAERMAELKRTIEELNSRRPSPKLTVEHTPGGTVEQEVHDEVSIAKNAEIDKLLKEPSEELRRMQEIEDARERAAESGIAGEFNRDLDNDLDWEL